MFIIPEFNPQLTSNNNPLASSASNIITYQGRIRTLYDALLILEATRLDILPTINRRLTPPERSQYIKPNTVFVWNETKCGMKRWTDGKLWSASKVYHGQFLIYRQLTKDKEVDPNGLIKQSFSVVNKQNHRLHLICYYTNDESFVTGKVGRRKRRRMEDYFSGSSSEEEEDPAFKGVSIPSEDPRLKNLQLTSDIYPDNLVGDLPKLKRPKSRSAEPSQLPTPPASTNTTPGVPDAKPLAHKPQPTPLQKPQITLPVPSAPGFRSQYSHDETSALLSLDRAF
ncbi:hypothetical protein DICA3_C01750 [Diutina catenulata]